MLATVYHSRNDVRAQEWPAPGRPPRGWVTVAVSACGICGTDIDEVVNGPVLIPTTPHPLTGRKLPLVLGHEGMGVVVAEGDAAGIPVGTRVGMENSVGCGTCSGCRSHNPQLCDQMAAMGLMLDGALAETVNVPATMCVPLPPGVSDDIGVLAEPLSVAVRAVRRGGDVFGRDILVFGAGAVGLFTAQVARVQGARSVVVHEPSATRRAIARELGLETAAPGDDVARAAVVFECSGDADGFQAALSSTSKSGVTVLVGVHPLPQPVDLVSLVVEERSIVASLSHTVDGDYRPAIDLLASGRIRWEPMVTDRVPLDRVVTDGIRLLVDDPSPRVKVIVDCRG